MAVYGLLGAEPVPPDERTRGRFARGRDAQRYHAIRLDLRFGRENVVREKAIPWPPPPALPVGELHTDLFVRPEALAIEIKSSAHPGSMFDSAMTQLAGQVVFDPEAERGALVFLDHDYQETATYALVPSKGIVERVEMIAATVVEAARSGKLPDRVCERPGDGRGRLCPFIEICFDGYQPPPPGERRDLAELASEYWLVERDLRKTRRDERELKARHDELRSELLERELPEGETDTGPVTLKVTTVAASQRFKLGPARKAGLWTSFHDEHFGDYVTWVDESRRVRATRVGEEPLAFDYGEEEDFPF